MFDVLIMLVSLLVYTLDSVNDSVVAYLKRPTISKNSRVICCRIVGSLRTEKLERIWKKADVAYYRYYTGLRKTKTNLNHHSVFFK